MPQWEIDSDALESADRYFAKTLAAPDLRGLTDSLLPPRIRQTASITDTTSREVYAGPVAGGMLTLTPVRSGLP